MRTGNPEGVELILFKLIQYISGKKSEMGTYKQIFYHIIFSTKNRRPSLNLENEDDLDIYIQGIIKNNKCKVFGINGMSDHVHIFCDLHPTIKLSDFIKDIKIASNLWMRQSGKFPNFNGWQEGYGAITCSIKEKPIIIEYIKNQKEHHKKETFKDEFFRILKENEIEFDENFFQ